MTTYKKGQYSLFEIDTKQPDGDTPPKQEQAPEQEPKQPGTASDWNFLIDKLEELNKFSKSLGRYYPFGGKDILTRCRAYYSTMIGDVEKYLNNSGLTEETITAIKRDYILALCGYYNFTTTLSQMAEAMNNLKNPGRAFLIDRYGLYRLLLQQYSKIIRVVSDYVDRVKEADTETKRRYIETFNPDNARAAAWAMERDFIRFFDFEGVDAQTVTRFADTVDFYSVSTDYCNFYHLCKYAYKATPEELGTIAPPEDLKHAYEDGFTNFLDKFCKGAEQDLSDTAKMYADALETPNPDIGQWNPNGVKLSVNLTTIQQKPIEVHTEYITDPISIRTLIANSPTKYKGVEYAGLVTEGTINKVIEGLNAMRSWGKNGKVKPDVDKILHYNVSMEDFTKICGYKDANQRDRLALLFGLQMLSNLYVRCDRPVRKPGKKTKYKSGWLQIFNLRYFADDLSLITIEIAADKLGGELTLVSPETYKKIQGRNIGLSERRFIMQILGKDNKNEEDLVNECFGYEDKLKWALSEDLKDVQTYIRKNKTRDRQKVQKWFDKYTGMGVIRIYTRTQNKAGEWIYKWKRGDTSKVKEIQETSPTP